MDDEHTRRTLNALADLFLTDTGPPTASPSRPAAEHEPQSEPAAAAPSREGAPAASHRGAGPHPLSQTSARQARSPEADPLGGPAPMRLGPKPAGVGQSQVRRGRDARASPPDHAQSQPVHEQPREQPFPFDPHGQHRGAAASPSEGWGHAQSRPGSASAPSGQPIECEGLVPGNLPGFHGPWLTQYAQSRAQVSGGVGLVRLGAAGPGGTSEGAIDIERVHPVASSRDRVETGSSPSNGSPGTGFASGGGMSKPSDAGTVTAVAADPVAALDALRHEQGHPLQHVLVTVEGEPDAAAARWLSQLPRWTLLCGADELARAAAVQQVQQLIEHVPALAHRPLGLWVAGAEEPTAREAGEQLRVALAPLMAAEMTFIGAQPRMGPVNVRSLASIDRDEGTDQRLRTWLDMASMPVGEAEPAASSPSPSDLNGADHSNGVVFEAPASDQAGGEIGHAFVDATTGISDGEPVTPGQADPIPEGDDAAATDDGENNVTDEVTSPDLTRFLTPGRGAGPSSPGALQGATPLEARCPDHPETQLLLDPHGRLHLLRRHLPAPGLAGTAESDGTPVNPGGSAGHATSQSLTDVDLAGLRAAVVDLLEARQWVRHHLSLLQLTQREQAFDPDQTPVLHLFTHRADLAAGLGQRLGHVLKLHLLEHVRMRTEAGWYCTPLN